MPEPRRETGWYWITFSGPPEIGFWDGEAWIVLGSETSISDTEVRVLGGPLEPPTMQGRER